MPEISIFDWLSSLYGVIEITEDRETCMDYTVPNVSGPQHTDALRLTFKNSNYSYRLIQDIEKQANFTFKELYTKEFDMLGKNWQYHYSLDNNRTYLYVSSQVWRIIWDLYFKHQKKSNLPIFNRNLDIQTNSLNAALKALEDAPPHRAFSRYLRNQIIDQDVTFDQSAMLPAFNLCINTFYAMYYSLLSTKDKENVLKMSEIFSSEEYRFLFNLRSQFATKKLTTAQLIQSLKRVVFGDKKPLHTREQLQGFLPHFGETISPRFLIIPTGGGTRHFSLRILELVPDKNARLGYKVLYTVADGGIGIRVRKSGKYSLTTSEITPKLINELGEPSERSFQAQYRLTDLEYKQSLEETILLLLQREYEILLIDHNDDNQWPPAHKQIINLSNQNNLLKKQRFLQQESGNCPVFSYIVASAYLCGENIANCLLLWGKTFHETSAKFQLTNLKYDIPLLRASFKRITSPRSALPSYVGDIISMFLNGEKHNGQDPIVYALQNNIKLMDLHPLEFAIMWNRFNPWNQQLIDGSPPVKWIAYNWKQLNISPHDFLELMSLFTKYEFQRDYGAPSLWHFVALNPQHFSSQLLSTPKHRHLRHTNVLGQNVLHAAADGNTLHQFAITSKDVAELHIVQDSEGETPMHTLLRSGHHNQTKNARCVFRSLSQYSEIATKLTTIVSKNGHTIVDLALQAKSPKLLKLLLPYTPNNILTRLFSFDYDLLSFAEENSLQNCKEALDFEYQKRGIFPLSERTKIYVETLERAINSQNPKEVTANIRPRILRQLHHHQGTHPMCTLLFLSKFSEPQKLEIFEQFLIEKTPLYGNYLGLRTHLVDCHHLKLDISAEFASKVIQLALKYDPGCYKYLPKDYELFPDLSAAVRMVFWAIKHKDHNLLNKAFQADFSLTSLRKMGHDALNYAIKAQNLDAAIKLLPLFIKNVSFESLSKLYSLSLNIGTDDSTEQLFSVISSPEIRAKLVNSTSQNAHNSENTEEPEKLPAISIVTSIIKRRQSALSAERSQLRHSQ